MTKDAWQYDDERLDDDCDCVIPQSLEGLVVAAWEANCLAKSETELYYDCKDCLLRKAVRAAQDEAVLDWGVSRDGSILYFDIPGRGQVSFHIFWDWDDPLWKIVPEYPHEWTEERNYSFGPAWVKPINAVITARSNGLTQGERHNLLVRAGMDPIQDKPDLSSAIFWGRA